MRKAGCQCNKGYWEGDTYKMQYCTVCLGFPTGALRVPERTTPIERLLKTLSDDTPVNKSLHHRILLFLNDLCHPEHYGHAVTAEIRKRARELANEMEKCS